jgi:hypothetical protein
LKSSTYPTEQKDQQPFVVGMIKEMIQQILKKETEFSVKIWTVEKRRLARNSTDVLIPAVELTFTGDAKEKDSTEFRKGASAKAKNKEKGYDGVYFSMFVGLATRVRIEVRVVLKLR